MIIRVSKNRFIDEFATRRPESFSYHGLCALYDHLEELDPDAELDVVAIDCEYVEYGSAEEAAQEFMDEDELKELLEDEDPDDILADWFEKQTSVICRNPFIIQNF